MDPLTAIALIRAGISLEEYIRGLIKSGHAPKLPDGTEVTAEMIDAAVADARSVTAIGIAKAKAELGLS
jgi:hypothetical protein